MELLAVAAVLGLAAYGKRKSDEKYASPRVQETLYYENESYGVGTTEGLNYVHDEQTTNTENINYNMSRNMLRLQGTFNMPSYGTGLQTAAPNQPGSVPLIKKTEIPTNFGVSGYEGSKTNFVDISPTGSKFVWGTPTYDHSDVQSQHLTNVQNGVNPIGQKINVGRGLGIGMDVPAAGGFHSESVRILPTNVNVERKTQIEGVTPTGAPVVPGTPLAPDISGYSMTGGITTAPLTPKTPVRETGPYTGGGSAARTFLQTPDPSYEKTAQSTIKDQNLTPYIGARKSLVNIFDVNPQNMSNPPSNKRGVPNPYVPLGSQPIAQTNPSISTQNGYKPLMTPPGPMNGSLEGGVRGSIGEMKPTPSKLYLNPEQNFNLTKDALANNPYAIPSFSS